YGSKCVEQLRHVKPRDRSRPVTSPVPKPRLASAALHYQDKIALHTPNRTSYPSCDHDTPKLRWALYPEQAPIAEWQSHEAAGNLRRPALLDGIGRPAGH